MGGPMPHAARYPANVGYPRAMAATAMVPRGYVHGANSYMPGGRALMPSRHNMVSARCNISFVWCALALAFITPFAHVRWLKLGLECCWTV